MTKRITVCVSGEGSNAKRLCEYFTGHNNISILKILSTKPNSKLQKVAKRCGTYMQHVSKRNIFWEELIEAAELSNLIVLAGFLWIVPKDVLRRIKIKNCRIMNIHPGPLPETEGLYGTTLHHTSLSLNVSKIYHVFHWVEPKLDRGLIIEEHFVEFKRNQTRTIAALITKVKASEHKHLAPCVERLLLN